MAVAEALRGAEGASPAVPEARHVIAWPAAPAPPLLAAADFAHCFFGLLRAPGASVPEVGGLLRCAGLWRFS